MMDFPLFSESEIAAKKKDRAAHVNIEMYIYIYMIIEYYIYIYLYIYISLYIYIHIMAYRSISFTSPSLHFIRSRVAT